MYPTPRAKLPPLRSTLASGCSAALGDSSVCESCAKAAVATRAQASKERVRWCMEVSSKWLSNGRDVWVAQVIGCAPSEIDCQPQPSDQIVGIAGDTAGRDDVLDTRSQVQPAFDVNAVKDLAGPF